MPRLRISIDTSALLVALLATATFLPALSNGFAFDDLINIVNNPLLRDPSALKAIFTRPQYPGDLYRPLTLASYFLSYQLVGLHSAFYHGIDVLLHAAVSVSLYLLLRRLSLGILAFTTAALFAVHPLHVEAVANVTGRAELLAALFVLAALRIGQREPRWSQVSLASLCFLAGLLSKESAVCLLLLFPLLAWQTRRAFSEMRLYYFGFAATFLTYIAWRMVAIALPKIASVESLALDNPLAGFSVLHRISIACALLGKYFLQTLWPYPLSADYSYAAIDPQQFWGSLAAWFSIAAFALILFSIYRTWKRRSPVSLFGLWFLASFVVTGNILFPIGTIYGERLAYMPSMGALGLFAAAALHLLSPARYQAVLTLVLGLSFCYSREQTSIWKDNQTLFSYQIAVSDRSAKTQSNYAVVLRNAGDLKGADLHFRQALSIYPKFANAAYGLGTVFALKGMNAGAEHWFHEALNRDAQHLDSLLALGKLYLNLGKLDDSTVMFQRCLAIDSRSFEAKVGLLALAVARNDTETAAKLRLELDSRDLYNRDMATVGGKLKEQ